MLNGTIVLLDGVPHVRCPMTLFAEPVEVVRYWPLPAATGRVDEGDETFYQGDGYVLVTNSRWGGRNYALPNGGQTEAVKVEEFPVPEPKTRLETRWKDGRWEKLTKRSGWVAA